MVGLGGAWLRCVVTGGMLALVGSGVVVGAGPATGSPHGIAQAPSAGTTTTPEPGVIDTLAGGGPADGTPATAAAFLPWSVTAAAAGVYVSTRTAVFRVEGAGTLIRVAGVPDGPGFSGDGGPAVEARLNRDTRISGSSTCSYSFLERCMGLAVDGGGNLYIADGANSRVRKVTPAGTITTVVGNGSVGVGGDGGPATEAQLENPDGLAFDGAGNLYIAGAGRIRKVDHSGIISSVVVVVDSQWGDSPVGLAVGPTGDLYFTTQDSRVRRRAPDGTLTTIAGGGTDTGDGGKATDALLTNPGGMTTDDKGAVYFTETSPGRVRRVTPDGSISTVAGGGTDTGDGGPATSAQINRPKGIVIDGQGRLLVADYFSHRVRAVSLTDGTIGTIAGNGSFGFSGDNVAATSAQLYQPGRSAVDAHGNVYVADMGNHVVRRIAADGVITTVAGTTVPGYSGDGGPGTSAQLNTPSGVALDAAGDLYIADRQNHRIRKLTPSGTISTVVGTGEDGVCCTGGPAMAERLGDPVDVDVDREGRLFIADAQGLILKVLPDGSISIAAGKLTADEYGDERVATEARLRPTAISVDKLGNLYIADRLMVRRVSTTGALKTFQGGSFYPADVAVDDAGNVYIANSFESRIQKVDLSGTVTNFAGARGESTFSGDGGPAGAARLVDPSGVTLDSAGNLYISDQATNRIRVVGAASPSAGPGSTFHPVTPQRVLDSRDGTGGYTTPWPAGTTRNVTVTGTGGVPANATAVVLNVTATQPTTEGHLIVYPTGVTRPLASNLNFTAGQTIPNLVITGVGSNGQVSIYNNAGTTHIIADIVGYYAPTDGSTYAPVDPARVLDSRDGTGGYTTPWPAGTTRDVTVTGTGGVPANATAVVLNVTATQPTTEGYATVYPAGVTRPLTSNLNFTAGQTVANLVVSGVGTDGRVSIHNHNAGTTHIIADIVGYYAPTGGSTYTPVTPKRVLETRYGPDGRSTGFAARSDHALTVTGVGTSVPLDATAVVLNVTATEPRGEGYLSVYPAGAARSQTSSLNFRRGQTVANLVVARVGAGGQLQIYNDALDATHVVADVVGYFR